MSRSARLLASLVMASAALTGCGITVNPPPTGPATNPDGFSLLDEAGIFHIEKTRTARFDLSDHTLTHADLGLDASDLGPIVGSPGRPMMTVHIKTPRGNAEQVRTSTFSAAFNSTGDADYFTWFESYDTREQADAALATGVDRWGLSTEDIASWNESVEMAAGEKDRSGIGPVLSPSGLIVDVVTRLSEDGGQTHQYEILLDPRYYTRAALKHLRRTGEVPTSD